MKGRACKRVAAGVGCAGEVEESVMGVEVLCERVLATGVVAGAGKCSCG